MSDRTERLQRAGDTLRQSLHCLDEARECLQRAVAEGGMSPALYEVGKSVDRIMRSIGGLGATVSDMLIVAKAQDEGGE